MHPSEFDEETSRLSATLAPSRNDEDRARKAALIAELRRVYGMKTRSLWATIVSRVIDTFDGRGLPSVYDFSVAAAWAQGGTPSKKCKRCEGRGRIRPGQTVTFQNVGPIAAALEGKALEVAVECPDCGGRGVPS